MEVRSDDFLLEVARGKVTGAKLVHKFGANRNVNSSWSTICTFGGYETPQNPVSLEIVSSSALDTINGTGARTVEVYGIDENWDAIAFDVPLNGTTPVVLPQAMRRIYRMHVQTTGSYATLSAGSHVGTITLRPQGGGGATYANIVVENGFPLGASEIGCFTIPRGHTGFIVDTRVVMEAAKICDVALFYRKEADIITAPYSPMFVVDTIHDISNLQITSSPSSYSRKFAEKSDIGFLVSTVSGSAKASVTYSVLLLDNNIADNIVFRD